MADVAKGDRGQLILITGLLVAVAFVALALLLNTAIFTENLASRGTDAGGREAIEFQRTVVDGVGGLIDAENAREHGTAVDVQDNVTSGIDEINEHRRLRYAERGTATTITDPTLHDGWLLQQTDGTRSFTNASGTATNWTLATGISDTRAFAITVTDEAALDASNDPDEAFSVTLVGSGGDRWSVYVYSDGASTVLAVKNGSETNPTTGVCDPSATPTVTLTAGTVDGKACSALQFAKGITPPYDIEYTFGPRMEGTFNLTVNTSAGGASVEETNFNDVASGSSPYQVPAVYSASLTVEYETRDLRYRARLRVAPGEPA